MLCRLQQTILLHSTFICLMVAAVTGRFTERGVKCLAFFNCMPAADCSQVVGF